MYARGKWNYIRHGNTAISLPTTPIDHTNPWFSVRKKEKKKKRKKIAMQEGEAGDPKRATRIG